jgi:hypothetical protein
MNKSEMLVYIYSSLAGAIVFIGGAVLVALRLQKFISNEFRMHRRLMYNLLKPRDRAIRRLEYHLIRRDGFQPGVDPIEFNEEPDDGDEFTNGSGH